MYGWKTVLSKRTLMTCTATASLGIAAVCYGLFDSEILAIEIGIAMLVCAVAPILHSTKRIREFIETLSLSGMFLFVSVAALGYAIVIGDRTMWQAPAFLCVMALFSVLIRNLRRRHS